MIFGPISLPIRTHAKLAAAAIIGTVGCNAGARMQLSAAQTLQAVMNSVQLATAEYHDEIRSADVLRRRLAIDAFVQRIRDDHDDEHATADHVERFNKALDRLQQDGETENTRYLATVQNIRTLGEIGDGLKRLAVESMSLDDELRRYLTNLLRQHDTQTSAATKDGS